MKKIRRIVFLLFAFAMLFQTFSYYFYGKRAIYYQYFDEIINYNYYKGTIGIYNNSNLTKTEQSKIRKRLQKRYNDVYFESDENLYSQNFRHKVNSYGLTYDIDYVLPFYVKVTEQNGTLYYGERWETKLIWCFGIWIKISRESGGIC